MQAAPGAGRPRTRRPAMLGVLSPDQLRLRHPNSGGTKAPSRRGGLWMQTCRRGIDWLSKGQRRHDG